MLPPQPPFPNAAPYSGEGQHIPTSQPFMPGPYPYPQQPHSPSYAHPGPQPYYPQSFQPAPHSQQAPAAPSMFPSFNPMSLMSAGAFFSSPQQLGASYVHKMQESMGWMSGSAVNAQFNISKPYVLAKLLMLLTPYLSKYRFSRSHETTPGPQKYKSPCHDDYAPDLYIPLSAAWTYSMLVCIVAVKDKQFETGKMYSTVWGACIAWLVHVLVAKFILRSMGVFSLPWSEVVAYTGYAFVPVCISIVAGVLLGKWGYWVGWGYGTLCIAIFLVRTLKKVASQEAKGYEGVDFRRTNYMLLALALFQFVYSLWLGVRPA